VLSKKESDYLSREVKLTKSYERVLKHRIREKLKQFFKVELPLLEKRGITEFYNAITENNNVEKNLFGNCRTHKISLSFPPI